MYVYISTYVLYILVNVDSQRWYIKFEIVFYFCWFKILFTVVNYNVINIYAYILLVHTIYKISVIKKELKIVYLHEKYLENFWIWAIF